jgi:hypothetical protein
MIESLMRAQEHSQQGRLIMWRLFLSRYLRGRLEQSELLAAGIIQIRTHHRFCLHTLHPTPADVTSIWTVSDVLDVAVVDRKSQNSE